ncbi:MULTISPECIES: acyloxyacyl hydrolase [Pseudomonas]|uniref:acyloxyacyl hydrolase n=2 Tax=Bacteria TaxID=2 RepID=UPI0003F958D0|nr:MULTISPECIES: acyloxyacyl hydrolase [Pseudomonas]TEK52628.1 acyloxyacyl hydrolase [Pseudomonas aeruginosa]TEK58443.1 acyloxyacyl hydrolase [Pseudomonas aeruginosa]TEK71209.1 acyloxyacyl hydrolase [Pseudomonas aeruginosa]TEK86036.1 acyloxyacyl hydrolase [Pseudomonas aeruginosa]TEK86749.1 acyloxyacyl hydrolase [Pseudomonas aeruginosa]
MKKMLLTALILATATFGAQATEISGALGATSQGGLTARAGVGFDWDKSWLESSTGKLTGYWDLGYTYWEAGDEAGGRHSLSFAPVFVYEFGQGYVKPFVEAGIGVAMFSGTTAGDQKFGSSFNFEDRLGAGLKLGDTQRVGIRVIHYSNAGIQEPNDGIESYSLFYSHQI